jgi:hypothetical protein
LFKWIKTLLRWLFGQPPHVPAEDRPILKAAQRVLKDVEDTMGKAEQGGMQDSDRKKVITELRELEARARTIEQHAANEESWLQRRFSTARSFEVEDLVLGQKAARVAKRLASDAGKVARQAICRLESIDSDSAESLLAPGAQPGFQDQFKIIRDVRKEATRLTAREETDQKKVEKILRDDPVLAEALGQQAGIGHLPRNAASDEEIVRQIAQRIPREMLTLLWSALKQRDFDFNLERTKGQSEAPFPTNHIEPVQMSRLEQLGSVLPEQLMQDDDRFYADLVQQQLLVMQPHNEQRKTLYILYDVSGSMQAPMDNGLRRHQWARAIAISLLSKATKGEANYIVRSFDDRPHEPRRVTSPEDAQQVIAALLREGLSGGGTYIWRALECAVGESRELEDQSCGSDIVLITDAEDGSIYDSQKVKDLLGSDMRLHVAVVGTQSDALKRAATTYREFR